MTKKSTTIERDKRLRRTAQETRDAGLRTPVSVRLTPEERAELESYARMRGMSLSEAIRSRACRYSPSEEKVAAYTERLYYGMRENGAELLESNKTTRMAYEENARAAFALSSAVRRVGVNVNQIAKKVNTSGFEDGEIWLAELRNCVSLLNEILETGNVESVRPIPPLETEVSKGGADASPEPSAEAKKEARNEPEKLVETESKKSAEIDAKKTSKTTRKKKAKSDRKPEPEPPANSDGKKLAGTSAVDAEPKRKSDGEPKSTRPTEPAMSAKPGKERIVPIADASRGETQEDVDAAWITGLLAKPKSSKRKRGGEMSDEWRERLEMTVSGDLPGKSKRR